MNDNNDYDDEPVDASYEQNHKYGSYQSAFLEKKQ